MYTTQKEKVLVRQLQWSDLNFVSEPRGVCFVVRVSEAFCRNLVREWRLRHARVMTADSPAAESEKEDAIAAVSLHEDAFKPCTVPQLHLPSGAFHPTVERKQLEHSDVRFFIIAPSKCACELIVRCRCAYFPSKASVRNPLIVRS
jgi:hypothetical protein